MNLLTKIKSWFKPKQKIEEKKEIVTNICAFCVKKIKSPLVNAFKCHYCGHYHCEKHRFLIVPVIVTEAIFVNIFL